MCQILSDNSNTKMGIITATLVWLTIQKCDCGCVCTNECVLKCKMFWSLPPKEHGFLTESLNRIKLIIV